eukprot:1160694-Pelagomonas_calceolata.AAC.7
MPRLTNTSTCQGSQATAHMPRLTSMHERELETHLAGAKFVLQLPADQSAEAKKPQVGSQACTNTLGLRFLVSVMSWPGTQPQAPKRIEFVPSQTNAQLPTGTQTRHRASPIVEGDTAPTYSCRPAAA